MKNNFKEKSFVVFLDYVFIISIPSALVFLAVGLGAEVRWVIFGCLFLFCTGMVSLFLSAMFETKSKYTSEFLLYIRYRLDEARSLSALYSIENEFRQKAIKNGQYCLSYPSSLREIHKEIVDKIEILETIS